MEKYNIGVEIDTQISFTCPVCKRYQTYINNYFDVHNGLNCEHCKEVFSYKESTRTKHVSYYFIEKVNKNTIGL